VLGLGPVIVRIASIDQTPTVLGLSLSVVHTSAPIWMQPCSVHPRCKAEVHRRCTTPPAACLLRNAAARHREQQPRPPAATKTLTKPRPKKLTQFKLQLVIYASTGGHITFTCNAPPHVQASTQCQHSGAVFLSSAGCFRYRASYTQELTKVQTEKVHVIRWQMFKEMP
jgi:hypothetical protein